MNLIQENELKNFTIVPNGIIDNPPSAQALALYVYMASRPEGWAFYNKQLQAHFKWSRHTLKKYMDQLVEFGYLERKEQQTNNQNRFLPISYNIKNPVSKKCTTEPMYNFSATEKNRSGKSVQHNNTITKSKKELKNNTEREHAPEENQNRHQLKQQKNNPPKVAPKGSLDINPEKYKSTADYFTLQVTSLFPDLIKGLQKSSPGNLETHLQNYFRNLQRKDEWFQLQEPEPDKLNQWIAKHYAGVEMWLNNEKKFFGKGKRQSNEIHYEAPKSVFRADRDPILNPEISKLANALSA